MGVPIMTERDLIAEATRNDIIDMLCRKGQMKAARLVREMQLPLAVPVGSVTAYEALTDRILAGNPVLPATRGMTTDDVLSPDERAAHDRAMNGMPAIASRGPLSERIAVTNCPWLHTQAEVDAAWAAIRHHLP
jgi:hypothetical protein